MREKSLKVRGKNRKSKTGLEAEKQDHIETLQEHEELKRSHETFKADTLQKFQELEGIIRRFTGKQLFWHILQTMNN